MAGVYGRRHGNCAGADVIFCRRQGNLTWGRDKWDMEDNLCVLPGLSGAFSVFHLFDRYDFEFSDVSAGFGFPECDQAGKRMGDSWI